MKEKRKISLTKSSMEYETTTELFQHRYYKLNRMFMKLTGQWPYQSAIFRLLIVGIMALVCTIHVMTQLMAIVRNDYDWEFLMECIYPLIFGAFCTAKVINHVVNANKMLMVINHMHADWKKWAHNDDVDVLHQYAERGRILTTAAIVMCFIAIHIYMMQPVIPKIKDVLLKNGTEPGEFAVPVDYYFIDMQKYYFYIILHEYLCASIAIYTSMTYDCMFFVSVQHCCGLFVALGHQLQRIRINKKTTEKQIKAVDAVEESEVDITRLRWCIKRHCEAIKFAELIEEYYSYCLLVILGLNMLIVSLLGLQIVKTNVDRQHTIRFASVIIVCIAHLYIGNYMAQIIMDCSIHIRYYIFESEWYKLPKNTKKILLFMMMRCSVPCTLTAGKIIILSTETFAAMLKTSLSYFTVLRSV